MEPKHHPIEKGKSSSIHLHFGVQNITLPETNIFAPENGWLEYDCFLLEWPILRACAVSFREKIISKGTLEPSTVIGTKLLNCDATLKPAQGCPGWFFQEVGPTGCTTMFIHFRPMNRYLGRMNGNGETFRFFKWGISRKFRGGLPPKGNRVTYKHNIWVTSKHNDLGVAHIGF